MTVTSHVTRSFRTAPIVVPEEERLPLPRRVNVMQLAPDILLLKQMVPWCQDLIDTVEEINEWNQSAQISSSGEETFYNDYRSSDSFLLTCGNRKWAKRLAPYELGVMDALHTAAKAYKRYNRFLDITDDTGYEILRYNVGQEFGEHIDTVAGHGEDARQLTAILYLNNDYEGGHTSFPRQDVTVKPDQGDVLLFPSNFVFPHVSPPIISGTKYVVVTWFVAYPSAKKGTKV